MELDGIDKKILLALQGDLDMSLEPYEIMAREIGVSEKEIIDRIRRMQEDGVIRRMGAMIRHIEAGIGFNGMVVWTVNPNRIEEVGNILASSPEVSHCYQRPPFGEKKGTLFTMVHSDSKEKCLETVRDLAEKTKAEDYQILFSKRELKKVSMTYFDEETQD
jgi:DNA-binding Lrp family transcriptional regulator